MSPRAPRAGLREEILDAAEEILLRTRSEDAVSVRAVATACGCTAPALYRHFRDKQHLLFEVCARHFDRLADRLRSATGDAPDPLDALVAMARAYVRFAVENPEHYRIMFMGRHELTPEQWSDETMLETSTFGGLVAVVQRCIDGGRFRSDVGDPLDVAFALWAVVHGVASLAVAKPGIQERSVDERLETALDIAVRGLLAPATR